MIKNWKLKLRYGKIRTPYKHYTLITPVSISEYIEDFSARPGTAYLGAKIWATDSDEAVVILEDIGESTGYAITGSIEIYDTAPEQEPGDKPYAYDFKFTYYEE
ncbi:hypothetical protein IM792_17470 [Mucilaginibacter sp. JRF]|uniref:hypothetical protein n=1 Tax=Mucilaginibacter sp. JRF TaxID=2780088 RepID=UPI00187FF970|nr:hypothetical protein [Mucilaginibacter sp. JRF]MBE9586247.1 hypothetical protein [Mucilaginibacter sp. JRF]